MSSLVLGPAEAAKTVLLFPHYRYIFQGIVNYNHSERDSVTGRISNLSGKSVLKKRVTLCFTAGVRYNADK